MSGSSRRSSARPLPLVALASLLWLTASLEGQALPAPTDFSTGRSPAGGPASAGSADASWSVSGPLAACVGGPGTFSCEPPGGVAFTPATVSGRCDPGWFDLTTLPSPLDETNWIGPADIAACGLELPANVLRYYRLDLTLPATGCGATPITAPGAYQIVLDGYVDNQILRSFVNGVETTSTAGLPGRLNSYNGAPPDALTLSGPWLAGSNQIVLLVQNGDTLGFGLETGFAAMASVTADSDGDGVADGHDLCPCQAGPPPNGCAPGSPGNIGGLVYCDLDVDGIPEPGEAIPNIDVELFEDSNCNDLVDGSESSLGTRSTGLNGTYRFDQLPVAGSSPRACYVVKVDETDPELFTCNNRTTPNERAPDLSPQLLDSLDNHFGFAGTSIQSAVGNRVWLDQGPGTQTNNGLLDAAEAGVGGVVLTLRDLAGLPLTAATTDTNGFYRFDTVPGRYSIQVEASNFAPGGVLEGHVSSRPTELDADSDIDSDDNGLNAPSPAVSGVTSGAFTISVAAEPLGEGDPSGGAADSSSNLTIDFGFFRSLSLGDRVWYDLDSDGQLDAGEPGIANVDLALFESDGTSPVLGDNGQPMHGVTDGMGSYLFDGLTPGDYVVRIIAQNFAGGGPLEGGRSTPGVEADPNVDLDGTDNGLDAAQPQITGVASNAISLDYGLEPLSESGTSGSAVDGDSNLTLDFGIVGAPLPAAVPLLGPAGVVVLMTLLLLAALRRLKP